MKNQHRQKDIYSASHASYSPGGNMMSIKALWDKKTLKVIGAQIVGFDGVDKRIDVLATVIRLGGKIKQFFWYDVENLPRDGSVTLLDVRTVTEISRGKIDGFMSQLQIVP